MPWRTQSIILKLQSLMARFPLASSLKISRDANNVAHSVAAWAAAHSFLETFLLFFLIVVCGSTMVPSLLRLLVLGLRSLLVWPFCFSGCLLSVAVFQYI